MKYQMWIIRNNKATAAYIDIFNMGFIRLIFGNVAVKYIMKNNSNNNPIAKISLEMNSNNELIFFMLMLSLSSTGERCPVF